MSQSFDINTSYDALDETVYDIFDVDAYCSSLSPSLASAESIPDTPTPAARPTRTSRTHGHPQPTPAATELTPEQHICLVRMLKRLDE